MDSSGRFDVDSESDCGEMRESLNADINILRFSISRPNLSIRFILPTLALLMLFCSCAGSRHFHPIPAEGPPSAPKYLEVRAAASVATMHFPAGVYSLYAEDDAGYYYRAPRKIAEHSAGTPIWHDGGIYVNKRHPLRLRGYVFWAGKLTHVGDLSETKHELHN
jgi:hypothetical protein